ncbi:MAG TPA: hypothetical protein VM598_00710, partial [Bdellovibrionota bacterium]|nr:hypothetical protein [Bdellovibrionota bacterium]
LAEVISVDGPRREAGGTGAFRELEQLERSLPIVQKLKPAAAAPGPEGPQTPGSLIAQQMEILSAEIRNIELSLERERANSRQYYDYAKAIEQRMKAFERQCANLNAQLVASSEKEASSNRIRSALASEHARLKGELERYRRAWQEIMRRDEEARKALQSWSAQAKRMQEAEQELRASHQQYVAERARTDLIETRAKEVEAKLAEVTRQARDHEARAIAKEQENLNLQDLCKAYEQRIQTTEANAAETLRNALESERRSSEEERRIITAQADARVAAESERMRADYERALAEQRSLYEEKIGALSREREMGQQTASGRILALEELVSQDRIELSRLAEGRAKIENELRSREARVSALRSECEILQTVLISEKSRYRRIADRLTDELIKIEAIDEIDPGVLDELTEASRLQTVESAKSDTALDC